MDTKTAVKLLKRDSDIINDRIISTTDCRFIGYRVNRLTVKNENEIADLITEQEKYAELGKLAIETEVCELDFDGKGCNKYCDMYGFCAKRAELMGSVAKVND